MWKFLHQLASPPHFYRTANTLILWLAVPGYLLILYGTIAGLFFAPPDYQQKDAFRIIYVHVPAAYLSMMAYMVMATAGAIGLIWRMKLAHAVAASAAPIGASFTALALATGSIWGRPMWGTWWEWGDPRLMSELILLFLYLGYMALRNAIDDTTRGDRASAVLAIVGAVNVPIIHFSVEWWSSLHQGPTLVREGGPAMDPGMLYPLLANILGFTLVFGSLLLRRVRSEVLKRERRTRWVRALVLSPGGAS
jgi:heme exporter protein C